MWNFSIVYHNSLPRSFYFLFNSPLPLSLILLLRPVYAVSQNSFSCRALAGFVSLHGFAWFCFSVFFWRCDTDTDPCDGDCQSPIGFSRDLTVCTSGISPPIYIHYLWPPLKSHIGKEIYSSNPWFRNNMKPHLILNCHKCCLLTYQFCCILSRYFNFVFSLFFKGCKWRRINFYLQAIIIQYKLHLTGKGSLVLCLVVDH